MARTRQYQALAPLQNTDAWLEARRHGIGSSDAPIIAGERGSILALWSVKTGRLEPEPLDPELAQLFEMGHRLEPIVAQVYTERTGRPLRRRRQLLQRRGDTWAFASLDRVSARRGESRIVELKTSPWTRWATSSEPVPGDVQAQIQHQLWVTGYDVADVAVLHRGYQLEIHEIARDDGFIADLVYLEREFWHQVETRTMPAVDGTEDTARALARMFPRDSGETLPGTPAFDALARELSRARYQAKAATNHERSVRSAIRAAMADASAVAGDFYSITLRRTKGSTEIDWPAIAADYQAELERIRDAELVGLAQRDELTEKIAAIAAAHTTKKDGYRQLRLTTTAGQSDEEESE